MQFDLHLPGAESLKDKRRVVRSVKDRLHREHQVSVAEVSHHDTITLARLGLAAVATDGKRVADVLDKITNRLSALTDAQLGAADRQLLHSGGELRFDDDRDPEDAMAETEDIAAEMLARFDDADMTLGDKP
ncbi:MAG: DUF503 domain-containing protein [Planctomycetota bacterium]